MIAMHAVLISELSFMRTRLSFYAMIAGKKEKMETNKDVFEENKSENITNPNFKKIMKNSEETMVINPEFHSNHGVEKKVVREDIEYEKPKKIFKDQTIHWCQDIQHLPGFEEMKKLANKILVESDIDETEKQFIIKGKKKIILEKTEDGLICKCNKFKITKKEEIAPYCKHYFAILMFKVWKDWNTCQK